MTEGIQFNFVGNGGSGDDPERLRNLAWEEGTVACMMHAWTWPLFCRLRDRGLPVSFGYGVRADAANFIHGEVARYQLSAADCRNRFIVAMRADFRPFPYGNLEVVQNQTAAGGRAVYMPHFPQPGLKPRDPARGARVENVCFSGQLENLGVDVGRLEKDLAGMGCLFVCKPVGEWQDMEEVDVLLGFRALSMKRFDNKPPTKLFNAWLAGIPFIGGHDSACEQVGVPDQDFIRVSTYAGLLDAIVRLKTDPAYYEKFVVAGRLAGNRYTAERTTDRWLSFMDGRVEPAYRRWRQGRWPDRARAAARSAAFAFWEKGVRHYRRAGEWK